MSGVWQIREPGYACSQQILQYGQTLDKPRL